MNIADILINRRSIRKYTEEKISQEQILGIIKCGMYAPSAVNKQPWHFLVISEKEILLKIVDFHPNAGMLRNASVAILVCGDEKLAHTPGYWPVDCAAATQNMLLAAYGMGLGAVWVGIYPREERMSAIKKMFHLPGHVHGFSIISLGYPAETPSLPDRFKPERIHTNIWNNSL